MGFEGSRVETLKANCAGLALAIAILAGCGGDKPTAPTAPSTARDTVHVSPDSLQLDVGDDASLTATVVDEGGRPLEAMVTWVVRDTSAVRRIVTTAMTAPILPLAAGATYVIASIPGTSDSAKVTVTGEVPPPGPLPTGRSFYVTPTGSGTACTLVQPCALDVALALVGAPSR